MDLMINMFELAFGTGKNDSSAALTKEEAHREWVRKHPATRVICEYFHLLFDRNHGMCLYMMENRTSVTLVVEEAHVLLSFRCGILPCCGFFDVHNNFPILPFPDDEGGDSRPVPGRCSCRLPFSEIFRIHGKEGSKSYYRRLTDDASRKALENMIIQRVLTLPHMKIKHGGLTLKGYRRI